MASNYLCAIMKVFKFGGASVKDAAGVRNLASIISRFEKENLLIVVSAMGKMTNAFEQIAALGHTGKDYAKELDACRTYHLQIIDELIIHVNLDYYIDLLIQNLEANKSFPFPKYYDQVVSVGELISTTIVSNYLNANRIGNEWVDARDYISTDDTWREGIVDWETTEKNILQSIPQKLAHTNIITQGFIGKTPDGATITLGREGSDYTGAVFSNILNAEGLWIWKDVPGVLTADPKLFSDAEKLPELTYYEAIEMTFNGAQVIHPKTLSPLQKKQIPLYVKSFVSPDLPGTVIQSDDKAIQYPPIIVLKKDQVLMSVKPSDFTFVGEEHLQHIYSVFARHHLKMNMVQIAALTISVVVDNNSYKIDPVLAEFNNLYKVKVNSGLELLTIRHFNEHILFKLTENKNVYLEQWTRNTVQFVYDSSGSR